VIVQRDMILALRDKIAALAAQNKTLEEVIAAKPTAEFDAQVPQGAQTADRFVTWMYAEVKSHQ
jgi:cyclase